MKSVVLNSLSFGYDDVGVGQNVLLLVHGHPFNRSMWQPQIDALGGADWRVIAPDLRGYGASAVAPGITTLDTFATDLAALLDHLAIDKVAIGGLSMGGQIVMEFCRLFPDRVRGIILAATFSQAETAEGRQARSSTADRLLAEGMKPYADEILPKMLASESIVRFPAMADHVLQMMRNTNPQGAAAALLGRARRPCYENALAALDLPALIVVGDKDPFTTLADAEKLHTLLRRSRLVCMKGAGHMPNLERAAQFNSSLSGFLNTLA